jgi:hypothetical protein
MSKKIYNLLILDESGSMESIKELIIKSFNEIVQHIRNAEETHPDLQQWVNIYSFNGRKITEQVPLTHAAYAKELTTASYTPNDMTPLFDAIGLSCNRLKTSIQDEKEASVLVTILTDGCENNSQEYDQHAIISLIKNLKKQGWAFTYIGTDHDVEAVSSNLGINSSMNFSNNTKGVQDMMLREHAARNEFYRDIKRGKKNDEDKNYFEDGSK